MSKKCGLVAFAVVAFGFVLRSNAGTEMVTDNSAQAPAYNYAPQPPPPPTRVVYYAPQAVRVVVVPTVRYYAAPVRVYGYQQVYRRGYCAPRHW